MKNKKLIGVGLVVVFFALLVAAATNTISSTNDLAFIVAGGDIEMEDDDAQFALTLDSGSPTSNTYLRFKENNVLKWHILHENANDDLLIQNGSEVTKLQINQVGSIYLPQVNVDSGSGTVVHVLAGGQLVKDISSIRYKENIQDLTRASWIYNLRPVTYDSIDGMYKSKVGLIAEEVELVQPQIVAYNFLGDDTKVVESVDYAHLTPAIIAELKYLRTELCKKDNTYGFCAAPVNVEKVEQPIEDKLLQERLDRKLEAMRL